MRRPLVLLVLLAALSIIVSDATARRPQNDAGTGMDAGDTQATATPLSSYGAYAGQMAAKDADWFAIAFAEDGPACVRLEAGSSERYRATLLAQGEEGSRSATLFTDATARREASFVVPSLQRTLVGFEGVPSGQKTKAAPGTYAFDVRATPASALVGSGDALSGMDAGDALASALAKPDACFGGSLASGADLLDTYAFEVAPGEGGVLSFAQASGLPLEAVVLDGAGATVASVASGGIASVAFPAPGTYALQVRFAQTDLPAPMASADAAYVLDLVLGPDDPPGSGCRPYCL